MQIVRTETTTGGPSRTAREEIVPHYSETDEVERRGHGDRGSAPVSLTGRHTDGPAREACEAGPSCCPGQAPGINRKVSSLKYDSELLSRPRYGWGEAGSVRMYGMTSPSRTPRTPIRRPRAGVVIDPVKLADLREERCISRLQLAEMVGQRLFHAGTVTRIEDGFFVPSTRVLQVLYAVLHGTRPVAGFVLDPGTLREQREAKGWSQEELAVRAADQLFSRDAIAKIENGTRHPKPATFAALCGALGCEPGDLLPAGHTILGSRAPRKPPRVRGARPRARGKRATGGLSLQDVLGSEANTEGASAPLGSLRDALPARAYNSLDRAGFRTAGAVAAANENGVLGDIPYLGDGQLRDIRRALASAGLLPPQPLPGDDEDSQPATGDPGERELASVAAAGLEDES